MKRILIKQEQKRSEKEVQHKFSKLEIKEIRKKFYEIENKNSFFAPKEIEDHLPELEEKLSKLKKYYDNDHDKDKGIRSIRNLFDLPTDDDFYKPVITDGSFNGNYIQYESMEDESEDKNK